MSAAEPPASTSSRVPGGAGVGSNTTAVAVGFASSVQPISSTEARSMKVKLATAKRFRPILTLLNE